MHMGFRAGGGNCEDFNGYSVGYEYEVQGFVFGVDICSP